MSEHRITVALLPKTAADLADLTAESGLSKTDLVNRSISLYRLITQQLENGQELTFVKGDELTIIHII